jgi:hypothetical protein
MTEREAAASPGGGRKERGPQGRRLPGVQGRPVPAAPLSSPVDLILHIGMGKTGTSSLQFFLRDNRERLRELGVLFPVTPGRARHVRLGLFAKPPEELATAPEWGRQKQSDVAGFRNAFRRRLFAEIDVSGLHRVLLTDEILFGSSEPTLQRLGRFAGRISHSLRVVVYLRRQDEHMVSRYQQGVKTGWVQRLRDWAEEDMSDLYDYHSRLRRQQRLLAPTELVVRRYESDGFAAGSLFQDFLDAAGIDVRAEDLVQVQNRNLSLDADSVEFLRLLNLHRVESEGATPGLIDNRALYARLAEVSAGPVLSLPAAALDGFMAQWQETNEQVARHFLRDAGGQLFRMLRKVPDITTEQRLDPGRLDHFFNLLELPDRWHAPLRRLAEREAK